jgi:plastocyanin
VQVNHLAQPLLAGIIMKNKQKNLTSLGLAVLVFAMFPRMLHSYEEIIVKDGATIRGAVKVEGTLPKLPSLQITKYKEICKDVPNESLSVGPGQGVRYAVVTLEGVTKGKAVEKETVHELDNIKCRFSPHVQAASVGQFVLVKNSDPILHTAHAVFTNDQPQFNVGLYPGRTSRKPLIAAGLVKIRCEVHPWMAAYIMVTEHPYHAVSDIYGEYDLSDVPPGVYQLKVWHESLGTQEKRIEVKPAGTQKVDFTFTASAGVKK